MKLFDGHCDTILRTYEHGGSFRENNGHVDLTRTRKFKGYAQFFAVFGDHTTAPGKSLYQIFTEQCRLFQREMLQNQDLVCFCKTAKDAAQAWAEGKCAAFLSVEGAELLDCSIDKLNFAYDAGVRAINITWNHPNQLSGSNAKETDRGLSALGVQFVARMQERGMLIDVSHLSDPGFWDVEACVAGPFFASHSNARAICNDPRNLTDAQFTAIIKHQGVAGLNMYAEFLGSAPDLDTVIAHIEHFLNLGGEQNIAIGGDWDGCTRLPAGIKEIVDLNKLYERLLQRNYAEALVDAIFYSNMMRVVNDVCTM